MAGAPFDIPVIDLTPYLNVLMFGLDVLEWTGVIPDPISLLIGLFTGRPREEATVQVIQRLNTSPNAAARLWAVELSRLLTEDDIVISSGGGAQTILGAIFSQFVNNLVAQGVDSATAGNIGVFALSRAAQGGAPLEPELQQPVPQGFSIQGPQSIQTLYQTGLAQGQTLGKQGTDLTNYAERYVYQHAAFSDLAKITLSQSNPTPPPGSGTPPPGPVTQPQPSPISPQPVGPTPQPLPPAGGQPVQVIPPPPPPDQEGDELTDCCNSTATYLYYIAQAIQNWAAAQNPASPDPCCTSLISQLNQLNSSAAAVVAILSGTAANPPAPVDLSSVIGSLDNIAAAIGGLTPPVATTPGAPPTTGAPGPAPAPVPDDCVCQELKKLVEPVPGTEGIGQAFVNYMVEQGGVDPALAQILTT